MAQEKRQFLKKSDWIIIGVLVVLAVGAMVFFSLNKGGKDDHRIAVVTVQGQEVLRVDLTAQSEEEIIDLSDKADITAKVQIKDHKMRFIEVDCPDHICEKTGYVGEETQSAICMPNKASITIVTEKSN